MNILKNKLYIIFHYKIIKYSRALLRVATSYIKRVSLTLKRKEVYKKSSCVALLFMYEN